MARVLALPLVVSVILCAAGCAPGRAVVEVTVAGDAPVSAIDHFQLRLTAPRVTTNLTVTPPARPLTVPPELTFTLSFDAVREGSLAVAMEARDASERVLAEGVGGGQIRASERTAVRVVLVPSSGPAPDLSVPGAPPDMSASADLSETD
jgi:hypothetical protein